MTGQVERKQATAKANTGVSPLRQTKSRLASVEMTGFLGGAE
jgi:hypothetical protein